MDDRRPSRIEGARLRTRGAKRALGVLAGTAFLAAVVLARVSHPGHTTQTTTHARATASASQKTTTATVPSIAPVTTTAAPQVQTSAS